MTMDAPSDHGGVRRQAGQALLIFENLKFESRPVEFATLLSHAYRSHPYAFHGWVGSHCVGHGGLTMGTPSVGLTMEP
jgi:hypothetical protein